VLLTVGVDQLVEHTLRLLHPRQVGQLHLTPLAGRLDGQRPAAQHPLEERVRERDVVDATERDVTARAGEDTGPHDHPFVGEDVVGRALFHPRPEDEENYQ